MTCSLSLAGAAHLQETPTPPPPLLSRQGCSCVPSLGWGGQVPEGFIPAPRCPELTASTPSREAAAGHGRLLLGPETVTRKTEFSTLPHSQDGHLRASDCAYPSVALLIFIPGALGHRPKGCSARGARAELHRQPVAPARWAISNQNADQGAL